MTITVHVPMSIDLARIRSVQPLAEGGARVVYVDAAGRYVAGTVNVDADDLRALIDRAEIDRVAADAWAAASELA